MEKLIEDRSNVRRYIAFRSPVHATLSLKSHGHNVMQENYKNVINLDGCCHVIGDV